MKQYLVLFREPDGRQEPHSADEIATHGAKWKVWQDNLVANGQFVGGNALTLNGAVIGLQSERQPVITRPYQVNGAEIVGGFLTIQAASMEEAVEAIKSCPIFDFGAFAEIREII